jgi:DNA repair protein RecO (recombination protein O)
MPGSLRTEAIVLRSIRYGEADRILHLYTPERGRVSAIAKGARRTRSRFGARLEPFFHLRMLLYQGRSELLTVTSVETLDAHGPLRERAASLDAAARACDAVARLFETDDPNPAAFHLLANELGLLDDDPRAADPAHQLAFRLKLLVAGGFAPQLASCASCGDAEHLVGFSGAAGGVVCSACEASAFPLSEEAHAFLVAALGRPLAEAPDASPRALRQAERAINETAEHHAHVRLRPLSRRLDANDRVLADSRAEHATSTASLSDAPMHPR